MSKLDEALGLFPSVIKCGEQWSATCQAVLDGAKIELAALRASAATPPDAVSVALKRYPPSDPGDYGIDLNRHSRDCFIEGFNAAQEGRRVFDKSAQAVCGSYAEENQRFHDRIEALEKVLREALEEIRHRSLAYVSDEDAVEWCHSIHDIAEKALAVLETKS
jgi:hypothetical protein